MTRVDPSVWFDHDGNPALKPFECPDCGSQFVNLIAAVRTQVARFHPAHECPRGLCCRAAHLRISGRSVRPLRVESTGIDELGRPVMCNLCHAVHSGPESVPLDVPLPRRLSPQKSVAVREFAGLRCLRSWSTRDTQNCPALDSGSATVPEFEGRAALSATLVGRPRLAPRLNQRLTLHRVQADREVLSLAKMHSKGV